MISVYTVGSQGAFTVPANAKFMRFSCYGYFSSNPGGTYSNDICINESNPGWNGHYYPHGTFNPFPDGLKSAGNIFDEIRGNKVVRRVGSVDMGTLYWYFGDSVFKANIGGRKVSSSVNFVCDKYATGSYPGFGAFPDKTIGIKDTEPSDIGVNDSAYTSGTAADFTAAMSGVMLYYEQAVPEEFDLATPIQLSAISGTTERRLPEDSPNEVLAPFCADFIYGTNNEQMLDTMDAKAVAVNEEALIALLDALKSASVIADYSITYNEGKPKLVITPNS